MEVSTAVWQERARVLLEESKVMRHFVIESSGVWNASERGAGFDDFPVDCEIERSDAAWTFAPGEWKPALAIPELADKDVPSLPFPFAAPELAAFMLGGMGTGVADFFGDWAVGPSTQSLNKLPAGQSELRALVKGAYSAYRLAQERVGKWDDAALERRDAAHKAYWGSGNDKVLLKAFDEAQAELDAAHQAWLTAMVVCLLEPKPQAATEAPAVAAGAAAQEQTVATPVVQAKARSRTWWDISAPYIVGVMKAGQYATAKELFRALEKRAGTESPFDKGSGNNKGSLYVREIAQSLSCKTVQNNWGKLRELAQTQAP